MKYETLGEERVRTQFTVTGDDVVTQIKQKTAELINLCEGLRGLDARLVDLAQTAYEEAAMWAVKAATTTPKDDVVKMGLSSLYGNGKPTFILYDENVVKEISDEGKKQMAELNKILDDAFGKSQQQANVPEIHPIFDSYKGRIRNLIDNFIEQQIKFSPSNCLLVEWNLIIGYFMTDTIPKHNDITKFPLLHLAINDIETLLRKYGC